VDSSQYYPSLAQIIPSAGGGYFTLIDERVSDNPLLDAQYYNRIMFKKFSFSNQVLIARQQLIAYQNKDPLYPQNSFNSMKIAADDRNGYVLFYSKGDVKLSVTPGSAGIGVENYFSSDLNACSLDSAFNKTSPVVTIDTGGHIHDNFLSFWLRYKDKYRLDWFSGYAGPGDPVYYNTQIFTTSLAPVSAVQNYKISTGRYDVSYYYSQLGRNLAMGRCVDSTSLKIRVLPLDSLFSNIPTMAGNNIGKSPAPRSLNSRVYRNRIVLESNSGFPVSYMLCALNGRTVFRGSVEPKSRAVVPTRDFAKGVYILKAQSMIRQVPVY
jgi:hypothetical protein